MFRSDESNFGVVKISISILLIGLMAFNSINKFGVFINFKIHQEYISKNICENRFKKSSTCNGKCYLSKELKKCEQESSDSKSKKVSVRFMDDYVHDILFFDIPNNTIFDLMSWNSSCRRDALSEFKESIFHPPTYDFLS